MFVHKNNENYIRGSSLATIRRNGDFIDVHLDRDGVREWIGILESDLRALLEISGHGAERVIRIDLDVPADIRTALKLFLRNNQVKELIENRMVEYDEGLRNEAR